MKVAIILISVLIAGALAEVPPFECNENAFTCAIKELAHNVKYHAGKLGDNLKDVGTAVLNSALDQGKDLLANGAQAVLGTVLEHLSKEGLVGKREVAFFDKVRAHLANGYDLLKQAKQALHAAFEKAVNKLTGTISDISGLKAIEEDADKKIDGVVEEFNKEGKKGFLAMAGAVASKLQAIFTEGMAKIIKKGEHSKKVEARAILGFDSLSDVWEKAKGHFTNVVGDLADTFQPHIDTLKSGISELADKAKEHAGNLASAATDSFNQLKDKLSGHVETLKGHASQLGEHATNALNALKEAVSSIALQTISNAKDTLNDAVKTGQDAAGVVKDHIGDTLNGSS
jgi:gas vesicle protein